ncbi:uncharacterized protein LOC119397925 isoform X2 [Rhipicephalus sanguineus]|uniref:uncharacterized protein LOC119397925 isoform X2 n=1 Tax=Rhipicephalus sanguineus TaxID=34632 RepID=UPI001892D2EC|nr:uncharacterized protein LOC119397925 isoform X2 [Rhipicephalus sanguineus]
MAFLRQNDVCVYACILVFTLAGETRLEASSIFVTEYIVIATTDPAFKKFKVFHDNETIITQVWHSFDDYIFRRCKQDMRNVMKDSYAKRLAQNAKRTKPINDSLFWNGHNVEKNTV